MLNHIGLCRSQNTYSWRFPAVIIISSWSYAFADKPHLELRRSCYGCLLRKSDKISILLTGTQIKGTVSGIEPGKSLTLRNVTYLSTGKHIPESTIKASEIQELIEAMDENATSTCAPRVIPKSESKTFEDPAILSVGKRPVSTNKSPINTQESSSSWEQVAPPKTINKYQHNDQHNGIKPISSLMNQLSNISVSGKLKENIMDSKQNTEKNQEISLTSNIELKPKKRLDKNDNKPRQRGRKGHKTEGDADQGITSEVSNPISKSRGWRQTPLLEPNPSFQPFSTLKRKGKRREEEGWGTEDATDVQELGDFDFEGGLAKFDKSTIFNQLQAEDSIAEKDRLASLNVSSRARSNNSGSKNLHHSENVIDIPKTTNGTPKVKPESCVNLDFTTDHSQEMNQREAENGRHVRRIESKMAINRWPQDSRPSSRKGTTNCSLQSSRSFSVSKASANPAFYIVSSGRRCDPISPLQMLNLENIACNELGLSEDILTENAGRSIAEVSFSVLAAGGQGFMRNNPTSHQVIVILAGNNKSGFRAVATARHIRNHGFNTVVCVLGHEQENELLAGLKLQIKVFRNFGGKVMNKMELFDYVKQLDSPIDLIIDGLIGLSTSFEELRLGDQSTVYELITWANRSKAPVLAIDIPTGIDPTNGDVSIIDGRSFYLCPNYVVALGAPKKGLLETMALGNGVIEDDHETSNYWQLFVADIGLAETVWKKAGTKIRRGIDFEENWVLKMRYKGVTE